MTPDDVRDRRSFEAFLRDAGFAKKLAARLATSWPASPEDQHADDLAALAARVEATTKLLKG